MRDVTVLTVDAIVSDPTIRSGRPIVAGTTIRVQDIANGSINKGYSVDELLVHYPVLNHTQIHAALAYYYAHKNEIDAQIEEEARPTAEIAQSIDRLRENYLFRDPQAVVKYLERHPFLIPILLEANEAVAPFFPAAALALEISIDREYPTLSTVILTIDTDLPIDAMLTTLYALDDAWGGDAMARAQDKLLIMPGSVGPK